MAPLHFGLVPLHQGLFVLIGFFGVTKWQKLFGVWQGTLGASRILTELGQFHQDRV
jgi:hypothetical protein